MEKLKSEAEAVAEKIEALVPSDTHTLGDALAGVPTVIEVSKGRELKSVIELVEPYREKPLRRKGTSTHKTLDSLIAHVSTYGSANAALFADPGDGSMRDAVILAVLNYLPATKDQGDTAWGDHRARYAFPLSEQWKKWKSIDGVPMSVADFARFLEARIEDLGDPAEAGKIAQQIPERLGFDLASPTDILRLSKGLSVNVRNTVQDIFDPATGERSLQFEAKHTDAAGKPLTPPKAFVLNIPVFKSGKFYKIGARITYEVSGSSVSFTVHLYREDLYFEAAFSEACEQTKTATGLPLYVGSPE